jgi:hypothetical protein
LHVHATPVGYSFIKLCTAYNSTLRFPADVGTLDSVGTLPSCSRGWGEEYRFEMVASELVLLSCRKLMDLHRS